MKPLAWTLPSTPGRQEMSQGIQPDSYQTLHPPSSTPPLFSHAFCSLEFSGLTSGSPRHLHLFCPRGPYGPRCRGGPHCPTALTALTALRTTPSVDALQDEVPFAGVRLHGAISVHRRSLQLAASPNDSPGPEWQLGSIQRASSDDMARRRLRGAFHVERRHAN